MLLDKIAEFSPSNVLRSEAVISFLNSIEFFENSLQQRIIGLVNRLTKNFRHVEDWDSYFKHFVPKLCRFVIARPDSEQALSSLFTIIQQFKSIARASPHVLDNLGTTIDSDMGLAQPDAIGHFVQHLRSDDASDTQRLHYLKIANFLLHSKVLLGQALKLGFVEVLTNLIKSGHSSEQFHPEDTPARQTELNLEILNSIALCLEGEEAATQLMEQEDADVEMTDNDQAQQHEKTRNDLIKKFLLIVEHAQASKRIDDKILEKILRIITIIPPVKLVENVDKFQIT